MMAFNIIIQCLVSFAATFAFAVIFSAPKKELLFCGIAGAISWTIYYSLLQLGWDASLCNLLGTLGLTIYCRLLSVLRKNPITVYLISGIFPLVPGAGIYYTSYYLFNSQLATFSSYGIATIKTAGAIVLGIIFGMAIPQAWFSAVGKSTAGRKS